MKKMIAILLSFVLMFSVSIPVSANGSNTCSVVEEDMTTGAYYLLEENGELYIIPSIETRMGGGIGRCTVQNKTFSYSMNRSQARAALDAISLGEGCVKSLGTLLSAAIPGDVGATIGLSVSVILNFLGGESAYVSALKTFLNSGKSTAYFKFKTHCVNRGYMYGDPMYDYEVDSVSITF